MVYEPKLKLGFQYNLYERREIAWENGIKTIYDIYGC